MQKHGAGSGEVRVRLHGERALAAVRGGAVAGERGGAWLVPGARGGGLRVRRGRRALGLPLRRAAPPAAAA